MRPSRFRLLDSRGDHASLPSCLPWLAVGVMVQRLLRSDRGLRLFYLAMAALLALSVLALVL